MASDESTDPALAFEQGTRAREARARLSDNPYDVGTPEYEEWAAGWAATLDLDEDDDPHSSRVKPGRTDMDSDPDGAL